MPTNERASSEASPICAGRRGRQRTGERLLSSVWGVRGRPRGGNWRAGQGWERAQGGWEGADGVSVLGLAF